MPGLQVGLTFTPQPAGASRQKFNRFAFSAMTTFKIQTLANGEWNDSAAELGFGCPQDDNLWATKEGALAACDELAADGFDRSRLRVVPADT